MNTFALANDVFMVILVLFIFASVIAGIVLAIALPVHFYRKKYTEFIEKNSLAYCSILETNKKYQFKKIKNFDMEHTYDNNDFYPNVSTEDYLTYQLVYIQRDVLKAIENTKANQTMFEEYKKDLKKIEYNHFGEVPENYKLSTLRKFEKKIVTSKIANPQRTFSITVTLKRTNIRGDLQEKKWDTFPIPFIEHTIKRINNKKGNRYLDQGIWEAIVRVERAKVSNKMRFALLDKYHNRCCKCGSRRDLEIDHIYPIAKGGKTEFSNLQVLCKRCNMKKGDSVEY